MQIIRLDSDDDIVSVKDRLDWSDERRVLLVLPENNGVLNQGLDLVQVRRHADRRRIEVGLVTADKETARQARALGLPTFATVAEGRSSRRGWWRGRRRSERVGLPTIGGVRPAGWRFRRRLDSRKSGETAGQSSRSHRRRWLLRYVLILLFFMTLAFAYVVFIYTVPRATITLQPEVQPVQVVEQIVADPQAETAVAANMVILAHSITVTQTWQADVETTGTVLVPDAAARGQVVFTNLMDEAVTVPAGTAVSTVDSAVVFQTVNAVTVAAAVGSTAEVAVVALEPGPESNVEADQIVQIEEPFAAQVQVRNQEALSGGGAREAAAVAETDRTRLRSQVLQFLQAVALEEMEAQLGEREFLASASLRVVEILEEDYSHAAGEQADRLSLQMRAVLRATAVDTTVASALVYDALAAQAPDGQALIPGGITFESREVLGVDEQGRVTFVMGGEGAVTPELDLAPSLEAIAGQEPGLAMTYLYEQLPLREVPTVRIWPSWFDRIPYATARIETTITE